MREIKPNRDRLIAELSALIRCESVNTFGETSPVGSESAMADSFANRRLMFHEGINSLPGVSAPIPEGAFYILADVSGTGMTDIEFATRALDEAKVQVIPGSLMLGGDNLIRMSYETSLEDLKEGIRRLKTWLNQIN